VEKRKFNEAKSQYFCYQTMKRLDFSTPTLLAR